MSKTLLIGWDAADWKVISPLIDAGQMPNLERLVANGVMGNLATLYPMLSPMLWTSIATGKRAWKHGIHGFAEPDPASGGGRPITNLGRKTKAVWNILNQHGLRSNVIGWWPSYPCEPINGIMVSDLFKTPVGDLDQPWPLPPGHVHPTALGEALAECRVHPQELDPEVLLLFVPGAASVDQTQDQRLYALAKVLAECASVQAAATWAMQQGEWDFTAVYFDAIDHFCHGFMSYRPPRLPWVSEADFALYQDVVDSGYRFHDLMLGVLLDLAGSDANVILCSDHGFHADHLRPMETPNEPAGPAGEHRRFGIFAAAGPAFRRDTLVFGATLLDIAPTILTLHGLPVGEDMDGRPLLQTLAEPIRVPPIPSWDLVPGDDGRHPEGLRVDPVDAREALKQLVDLGYVDDLDADCERAAANTVRELRYNLARDLAESGKVADACAIQAELWEANPDQSRFGVHLFNGQLRLGDTRAARETLALIEIRKKDYAALAQRELEGLREAWQDREPAELSGEERQRLRSLVLRAGTNRTALAWLRARLLMAEGRPGEALAEYEQCEAVQQHNLPSLRLAQGDALMVLRRYRDAEARFREALALDPSNADAGLGLGRALMRQGGRAEEAFAAVSDALGVIFHSPRGHYLRGLTLMALARRDEARAAFERALSQNPLMPAAYRRLAQIAWFSGDNAQAEEYLGQARAAGRRLREAARGQPLRVQTQSERVAAEAIASLGPLGVPKSLPALAPDEVVIVSGLPRSGTSMLMHMLRAGGLPILADDSREPDVDNPDGYLEYAPAKRAGGDSRWLQDARGRAVKIVAQLLPALTARHRYRVIFMERPIHEVVASQRAMLERTGKAGGRLADRRLAETFIRQVAWVAQVIEVQEGRAAALSVAYHEALAAPALVAARINAFLGGGLDEPAMAAAVKPGLRRQGVAPARE